MTRISNNTLQDFRKSSAVRLRPDLNVKPGLIGGGDKSCPGVIRRFYSHHNVTTGFFRRIERLTSTYRPLKKENFGGSSGVAYKAIWAPKAELDDNTVTPLEFFHIRTPFDSKALR